VTGPGIVNLWTAARSLLLQRAREEAVSKIESTRCLDSACAQYPALGEVLFYLPLRLHWIRLSMRGSLMQVESSMETIDWWSTVSSRPDRVVLR